MALGPGKYDALATYVRETAAARGAIVLVIEGNKGSGFSAQVDDHVILTLPQLLRNIADQIEGEPNG